MLNGPHTHLLVLCGKTWNTKSPPFILGLLNVNLKKRTFETMFMTVHLKFFFNFFQLASYSFLLKWLGAIGGFTDKKKCILVIMILEVYDMNLDAIWLLYSLIRRIEKSTCRHFQGAIYKTKSLIHVVYKICSW